MKILFLTLAFVCSLHSLLFAQYTKDSIYTHARSGNKDEVRRILEGGYNQNMLDNTLGAAVAGNQSDMIHFLIEKGADINQISSFNTPLLINAIMYGFDQSALALIEAGANLDIRGFKRIEYNIEIEYNWTPLMCAARKGNLALIRNLLDHGADPNEKGWSFSSDDIETSADIAAYSGHLEALKLLKKKGAGLQPTTIFKTVRGGHFDTFKFLLKSEKKINRIGPAGKTLLMEASWWGRTDIVHYLLKKKADPNIIGENQKTALLEVLSNPDLTQKSQVKIVKALLRKDADKMYRTSSGLSAQVMAKKLKRPEVLHALN